MVGFCGFIFIWLLGSVEKQMGIRAHKATLKAKGLSETKMFILHHVL